ncbi:uncharacterized protein B0H64DRAFT_347620, partial [Chaetomium fimeti]
MEASKAPRPLSDDFEIHEYTQGDVASPGTAPLLRFLLNFTKPETDYQEALKSKDGRALWSIGNEALRAVPFRGRSTRGAEPEPAPGKHEIPDESAQDEATYTDMINGPGLKGVPKGTSVTIVGGGISGLVAGYELKRAGFVVHILEASSRVGGRIVTFRDPVLAPGLHGEGGAMRIPGNHFLLRAYLKKFQLDDQLFRFEMKNKFIYLSDYQGGSKLTYDDFNKKLNAKDRDLLAVFPGLDETEKGKTCDQLFLEAVAPVVQEFEDAYNKGDGDKPIRIRRAYQTVTRKYDKYTLRSFLKEVAGWSDDAIRLYDLGNAHVVYENGFIESWKDAFLSSNTEGQTSGMQQLQYGMDQVPKAFLSSDLGEESLDDNITYGARVTHLEDLPPQGDKSPQVKVHYETANHKYTLTSDYVILAVPYTAQRLITKSRPFRLELEQAIRDVRYIEVTKVLLQYKKRWWEQVFTENGQGTDGGLVSDLPIRYTMFPVTEGNTQTNDTNRGAIMAAYTFQQDATILSAMPEERRVRTAAENLDRIFPGAGSLKYLEGGTSQAFPTDELAGGSAFCYFGPRQKGQYLETMCTPDWAYPKDPKSYRVFLAGEHASYTHGWIQGAMEAALRCVSQVHKAAT